MLPRLYDKLAVGTILPVIDNPAFEPPDTIVLMYALFHHAVVLPKLYVTLLEGNTFPATVSLPLTARLLLNVVVPPEPPPPPNALLTAFVIATSVYCLVAIPRLAVGLAITVARPVAPFTEITGVLVPARFNCNAKPVPTVVF